VLTLSIDCFFIVFERIYQVALAYPSVGAAAFVTWYAKVGLAWQGVGPCVPACLDLVDAEIFVVGDRRNAFLAYDEICVQEETAVLGFFSRDEVYVKEVW
jgi:hypothetical protein